MFFKVAYLHVFSYYLLNCPFPVNASYVYFYVCLIVFKTVWLWCLLVRYIILDNYRVISYSLLILYVAFIQFGSGHLIKITRENVSYVIMVKRLGSDYVSPKCNIFIIMNSL